MKPELLGAVTALAGGSAAGGYALYSHFSGSSFSEALKGTLLSLEGEEDKSRWEKRLTKLKGNKDSLVDSLKAVANKNNLDATWSDVQAWCKDNLKEKVSKDNQKLFDNVQLYCTFNIGDKLSNKIDPNTGDSDNKWKKVFEKLGQADSSKLDQALVEIKSKNNQSGDAGNKAIKQWCTTVYESPFKLPKDKSFEYAESYCVEIANG
ncbi:hypothetical protein HF1_05320 [Mycoplasma haemofelis str. Langford 1]|uniref:Uncharacterized protein n=1 Tax=Mycoplasma haemofelis (strain Langford 1) TaxID=941640 RepID=E8ZHB9_MYCHL|nr:hypothetical protein [Mycoplasma haemofelis]CBY92540.1 hypothetical protein HF1_05320 [Mycoplasma haemofelis str. Langford 1]